MKKTIALFLQLLILFSLCASAHGDTVPPAIEQVVQEKTDIYSCSFDGVEHRFLLDFPADSAGAPLVLMLPGYGNTAEAFRSNVHFETEANALGYAVAYVTGAPDPNIPTSALSWHSESDTDGNRDVEFLVALADYLAATFSLDRSRVYAVGFSNGAFMAHRLAMDAGDVFAACVSVAGLMPESVWNTRRDKNEIGFFQITGEKDSVIPKNSDGSAKYTKAPAIEDVMAYWAGSNGLNRRESFSIGTASVLTKYSSDEKPQQVWDLFIHGGHHSWPSEKYNQIDTNVLILEFFEAQSENTFRSAP